MPRGVRMREFHKKGSKATQVWRIGVGKDKVYYESGQLGGKMTPSSRFGEAKNVGRSNEVSPEQDAKNWMETQIKLKVRKGYREVDKKVGKVAKESEAPTSLDFSKPLPPENFRVYKPQNNMGAGLRKKLEVGEAWALRKRNGNGGVTYVNRLGHMSLLTLTMQASQHNETAPYFERYPKIREALELAGVPPNSVLCGELVVRLDQDDYEFQIDDLDYVSKIRGSKTDEALHTQETEGALGYCIWDVAWWDGENLLDNHNYRCRFNLIRQIVEKEGGDFLSMPEVCVVDSLKNKIQITHAASRVEVEVDIEEGDTVEQTLCNAAMTLGWEGFVIVDPDPLYGEKAYNFKGTADRPKHVAKLKPIYEGDFIVRWDPDNGIGRRGKGKRSKWVGSLQAYLIHPEKGEIEIARVGTGITDEMGKKLADPSIYPQVAQIEFGSWTKDGSLQFPDFVRLRDDKELHECIVDQNPRWKRHYGE